MLCNLSRQNMRTIVTEKFDFVAELFKLVGQGDQLVLASLNVDDELIAKWFFAKRARL